MDTRTWAGITLGAALAAVLMHSCEAKAYEKSACKPIKQFEQEWFDEAGEMPFFDYLDTMEDGKSIIKGMFLNPDTGTWTLVERTKTDICTWRSGKGFYLYMPRDKGQAA